MSTIELNVAGMTCNHCEAAVKGEVGKVPGVQSVDVDLQTNAVVVHGVDLDHDAIVAAIDEAGYEVV